MKPINWGFVGALLLGALAAAWGASFPYLNPDPHQINYIMMFAAAASAFFGYLILHMQISSALNQAKIVDSHLVTLLNQPSAPASLTDRPTITHDRIQRGDYP